MDVTHDVFITQDGPQSKQDAFKQAIEEVSLKLIQDTLGPDLLEKNLDRVKKQILSQSDKYVLFIKGSSQIQAQPPRYEIQMKISLDNLDALLRESGLTQLASTRLRLVPFLEVNEEGSPTKTLNWAPDTNSQKAKFLKAVTANLAKYLKSRNIEVLDPATQSEKIPGPFRRPDLSRDELLDLGHNLSANLVIFAKLRILNADDKGHGSLKVSLFQVHNERLLSDEDAQVESSQPKIDELAVAFARQILAQIKHVEAQGRLNTQILKLTVDNPLDFRQLENFKKALMNQIRDIRVMKDRLFAPGKLVFELESVKPAEDLAKILRKTAFPGFQVDVESVGAADISMRVQPQSGMTN